MEEYLGRFFPKKTNLNIGFFDSNTDEQQKFLEKRLLNKDKKSNETLYNDIYPSERASCYYMRWFGD